MGAAFSESKRSDRSSHSEHQSDALTSLDGPQPYLLVRGPSDEGVHVRVELEALYVRHVSCEDANWGVLLHVPHVGSPVVRARGEVPGSRIFNPCGGCD